MGHYMECIYCGHEKGHADDCRDNPNRQRTLQIQLSRQRAHDSVEAALSSTGRLTEDEAIRLAKVINGPFDSDGFAAKAGHSIDELCEIRWKSTPRAERMIAIQQARALHTYLKKTHEFASLYYEAHVTIEPVFDERLQRFREIAGARGFRVADLLMKKRMSDIAERSGMDSFCTTRGQLYAEVEYRTLLCVQDLIAAGFRVYRYKIEDTLLDSRMVDKFKTLGGQS